MRYREKIFICGNYLECEYFPILELEAKKARSEKIKETTKKMKNLNDKNRVKNVIRLANTNFTENDLFVTVSYTNATLPQSLEEAKKKLSNFLKRLRRRLKKEGLPQLKYIAATQFGETRNRIHHHLIISGDLSRDVVENLWIKSEKGICNTQRLQFDEFGIEGLVRYMLQGAVGYKKVTRSRNLIQPKPRINDFKYSKRKIYDLANSQGGLELEKEFKGYKVTAFDSVVNKVLDVVYISVKMKKINNRE